MMKYTVKHTVRFKKDYKLALRQNKNIDLLQTLIVQLAQGETLPKECKDHNLTGNWIGHRECHIAPDWLLLYRYDQDVLVLTLSRTGSHSDVF